MFAARKQPENKWSTKLSVSQRQVSTSLKKITVPPAYIIKGKPAYRKRFQMFIHVLLHL